MMSEVSPKVLRPEVSSPSWFPTEGWAAVTRYWTTTDLQSAEVGILAKIKENSAKGQKSLWLAQCLLEVRFLQSLEFKTEEEKKALDEKFIAQFEEVDKMVDFMLDEFKPESGISGWFSSPLSKEEQDKRYCLFLSALVASGYSCCYKGAYHYQLEEQIRGSYYLKKAWEAFSRADKFILEQKSKTPFDPAMVGLAGFGVAIFQLSMSLIPPVLQTIGQLVGFEANRENAIKLLNATYTGGCPKSIEAGVILVFVKHFLEDKEDEAKNLLQFLLNGYPDSIVLATVCAFMNRFTGDLKSAILSHQKVLDYHEKKENARPIASLQRDLGTCYWFQNDFRSTIPYYERFLEVPIGISKKNYRPTVAFNLGICYWLVDQETGSPELTSKIVPLYTKALKEWIRDDESFDLIAKRKMEHFLSTKTFTKEEIMYEKTNALIEGKQWNKARELIEQSIELQGLNPGKRDLFSFYFYILGKCDHGKKDYKAAKENLEKALKEEGKVTEWTWIVPYAWFALGEIEMDQKHWNEAVNYFDKAQKYKEYDWDKLLAVLIYTNKQTLISHVPNLKL